MKFLNPLTRSGLSFSKQSSIAVTIGFYLKRMIIYRQNQQNISLRRRRKRYWKRTWGNRWFIFIEVNEKYCFWVFVIANLFLYVWIVYFFFDSRVVNISYVLYLNELQSIRLALRNQKQGDNLVLKSRKNIFHFLPFIEYLVQLYNMTISNSLSKDLQKNWTISL